MDFISLQLSLELALTVPIRARNISCPRNREQLSYLSQSLSHVPGQPGNGSGHKSYPDPTHY